MQAHPHTVTLLVARNLYIQQLKINMAEANDSEQQLHIAALTFPFGTHAAPLLALLRQLATSLPPNTIFSFFSTEKSNIQTFNREVDPFGTTIKPYNVWDGIPEDAAEEKVFHGKPQAGVEFFLKAVPGNFKKAIGEAEAESGVKISCILSDAFLWFSDDLAAEMGVPWVAFWTAGSCPLSVHLYTDEIRRNTFGMPGVGETVEHTLTFIPGLSAVHIDDLIEGIVSGNLESPIALMLHKMGLKLPRATAVVVNSFEEFEPVITNDLKLKLQKVLNVGPLTLSSPPLSNPDENGCLLWLEKQMPSSVAYISFGSMMTPPPNEMLALAQALESLKVPFLWSLRDHSRHLLPEGFVERTGSLGKVVPWAPQSQVLAHQSVGVSVSHCGWNSILESVAGGVPMICRPFFGDQTLNARMVQDVWRIGIRVEGGVFTRSGSSRALELVLLREEGKKMKKNISGLKESAVKAVGLSGSSTANFKTLVEVIKTCK